ncbi:MAG TPA: phosphoenolpyruvate carboxykinase (ATP), partial [Longimicrobiales bacterium]|nr:phosphoenolpyruvate carboxykinase (ATP) [Longimicrobiales bacterium]
MATKLLERDLTGIGMQPQRPVRWNSSSAELIEHAVRRNEGVLSVDGSFVAVTRPHTGRSPDDKFVVRDAKSEKHVAWGKLNVALTEPHFEALYQDVRSYLAGNELFVQDLFAGAEPTYRLNVRVVTTSAWHAMFARNMFIPPLHDELSGFVPGFTLLHAPELQADPARHGTRTGTFIVINFAERVVLIGGTRYAGEIKKSIFTV